MNGINQHQQITGLIQNFKMVGTRTGRKMAIFMINSQPAKCFDLTVDQAQQWADTGQKVSISGQFSNHNGQVELVAQDIVLMAPRHTGIQIPQQGYVNTSAARHSSSIIENLCGAVSNIKTISTHSSRPMITFEIAGKRCKAFGDLATRIQKIQGHQIGVSGRKGTFHNITEYAVEIINTIDGTVVDLWDSSKPRTVPVSSATGGGIIDAIQQKMHESVTLSPGERDELAEFIAASPSPIIFGQPVSEARNETSSIPSSFDDLAESETTEPENTVTQKVPEDLSSSDRLPEPKLEAITAKPEVENQTVGVLKPKPVSPGLVREEEQIRYWIKQMIDDPTLYPEETMKQLGLQEPDRTIGAAASMIIRGDAVLADGNPYNHGSQSPGAETFRRSASDELSTQRRPAVQGTISNIKGNACLNGRRITFLVGPHFCYLTGQVAELLEQHASDYEGRLIAVYGAWKTNHRGRLVFVSDRDSAPASDRTSDVTADEVQVALEDALIVGSSLLAVGAPSYEEAEADYEADRERKRLERASESSAVDCSSLKEIQDE
jgi:hypothetical protein